MQSNSDSGLSDAARRRVEGVLQDLRFAGGSAPAKRPRTLRRVALVAVALVTLGGIGWVRYGIDQPTVRGSYGCYERADLNANTAILDAAEGDPLARCTELWTSGEFTGERPESFSLCVLPSGIVGAFPGADVCGTMNLSAAKDIGAGVDRQLAIVRLRDALVEELNIRRCLSVDDAVVVVSRILVEYGFREWTVEALAPGASRCAAFGLDERQGRIVINSLNN